MIDLIVRCSSLPIAMICPGSIRPVEVEINPVSEPADTGTAVHFGLKLLVQVRPSIYALAEAVEKFPQVDKDELEYLFWAGYRMWQTIREWMSDPEAETYLSHGFLSGHLDVKSKKWPRAEINDWKSGYKDAIYKDQGFGYAWLKLQEDPSLEEIGVHFAWLRTGEIESYVVSRERADQWYQEFVEKVVEWDGIYRPGDQCTRCKRNHDCPAQTALVRRDVALFHNGPEADLATMDGPTFVTLHRKLKGLATRIEAALKAMRADVERRGGDVDAGDGSHLHFREENGQRKVDAMKAWPILQSRLTDEELAPAIKISLTTAEKAVAAKAGKGKGAKACRDLAEDLEKAGAVSQPKVRKLIDERIK